MKTLNNTLNDLINTPSDINEHLSILFEYGKKCTSITEFGVRGVVSTVALIFSNPKKMVCVDLKHPSHWGREKEFNEIVEYSKKNNINYKFVLGDTRTIDIDETDLLFIDTMHTYQQLKSELNRHHTKVNKFLIFHDTELYGIVDENNYDTGKITNSEIQGLWPAIEEFLKENKNWKLIEKRTNNNGLTILERINK
jgi:hypothetical protein